MLRAIMIVATLLAAACNQPGRTFVLPTAPTTASPPTPAPTPAPPPPPPFGPPAEVTSIRVGEVVTRTIDTSPPGCLGNPEWPCQFFRVTPPVTGTLRIELMFVPDTQPQGRFGLQGVDISLVAGRGSETWAEFGDATTTRLTAPVTGGTEYQITLWYTYPKLQYVLRTTMQ